MGDPFGHNRHEPKMGGLWSLSFGDGDEIGPHLTLCGLGLPSYKVTSWSIQQFGHNRHGPKIGGCAFFWKGAGFPSNTSNTMWTELRLYLYTTWHLDASSRLSTIDMAEKWGLLCPLLGRGAGSPCNTMWRRPRSTAVPVFYLDLSNRLARIYQRYKQTDRTDRQGRQDRQTYKQTDNGPIA